MEVRPGRVCQSGPRVYLRVELALYTGTWTPNVSQARAPASVYLCVELALAEGLALLGGLGGQLGDVVRLGLGVGVKVGVGVGVRVRGWG